jgi:hypothetical protein
MISARLTTVVTGAHPARETSVGCALARITVTFLALPTATLGPPRGSRVGSGQTTRITTTSTLLRLSSVFDGMVHDASLHPVNSKFVPASNGDSLQPQEVARTREPVIDGLGAHCLTLQQDLPELVGSHTGLLREPVNSRLVLVDDGTRQTVWNPVAGHVHGVNEHVGLVLRLGQALLSNFSRMSATWLWVISALEVFPASTRSPSPMLRESVVYWYSI